jgi:hypothetical protein
MFSPAIVVTWAAGGIVAAGGNPSQMDQAEAIAFRLSRWAHIVTGADIGRERQEER